MNHEFATTIIMPTPSSIEEMVFETIHQLDYPVLRQVANLISVQANDNTKANDKPKLMMRNCALLSSLFYHVFSFFFFLLIDLYFSIPAVIAQIFNPTAELLIPTGTTTNEVNTEF